MEKVVLYEILWQVPFLLHLRFLEETLAMMMHSYGNLKIVKRIYNKFENNQT
jgi:hypothetical protein